MRKRWMLLALIFASSLVLTTPVMASEPETGIVDDDGDVTGDKNDTENDALVETNRIVSVVDYGADGSDENGDRYAFQSALYEARERDEILTVIVPAGTYHISGALNVYSNTYIKCEEGAVIVRDDPDRNLVHNVGDDGSRYAYGYEMSHDITIEGGVWDGGDISKATDATDVFRFDHAENVTVKDAVLKNVYDCHLLEFVGVKNGLVSGCEFSGFRYRKGCENIRKFGREAIQLESDWWGNPDNPEDKTTWAGGGSIDGTPCDMVTVENCKFIDYPCCVGQHHYSTTSATNSKHIIIRDNEIIADKSKTYFKTAISCGGIDDITISGNKIEGSYEYGINIYHSTKVKVDGNSVKYSNRNGINAFMANVTRISGNTVSNIGKNAISIQTSTVGSLSDQTSGVQRNKISSSGANGITIAKETKIYYVNKNTVTGSGTHGISVVGSKITIGSSKKAGSGIQYNVISNSKKGNGISYANANTSYIKYNKISNVKNNGISFVSGKAYAIQKNTIKKAKKTGLYVYSKRKVKKKISKNKISGCKRKQTIGK